MKHKNYAKRIVSAITILSIIISQTSVALADAFRAEPTVIEGTRFTRDQLIDGDLVYFGVATLNLNEADGIYEVPVYREGDLSKEASVTIHSLDISALYKEDYVLLGGNKKEYRSEMTLLERGALGVSEGEPEEICYEFDEYGNLIGETGRIPVATPTNLSWDETIFPPATPTNLGSGKEPVSEPVDAAVDAGFDKNEVMAKAEAAESSSAVSSDTQDTRRSIRSNVATPTNLETDEDPVNAPDYSSVDGVISAYSSTGDSGRSRLALLKEQQTGEPTRETAATELGTGLTETIFAQLMPEQLLNIPHSAEQKIVFSPGEAVKYVRFRVYDDGISESSEAFSLIMMDTENVEPYIATSLSVILTDDEDPAYSKISFDDEVFGIVNGRAAVRVRREEAEYSMATANIRGTDTETGESRLYGTVVFAPYETEKETELYISGETRLSLSEYSAAEPGETTEAIAVPVDNEGIALLSLSGEAGINAASETGNNAAVQGSGDNERSFKIWLGSGNSPKEYNVKYKTGDIVGSIYDETYDPALKVGDYYFSASTSVGGIFSYGKDQRHGSKPWGCGTIEDKYVISSGETDYSLGYGELKYYHTTTTAKGDVWTSNGKAGTGKPSINGLYYQYLIPHWEQTNSFGGSNKVMLDLKVMSFNKSIGSSYVNGKFSKSLPTAGAVTIKNIADNLEAVISAADTSGTQTPKSYMKFYGIAAMYKKYLVNIVNPDSMSFKGSSDAIPMQVKLQCGAQMIQPGSSDKRWIFANTNENDSNIVFTVNKNTINGADGIFGIIKGYNVTVTASDNTNKVSVKYPDDYVAYLNKKKGQGNSAIDFSSAAVKQVIARVNEHLDTVIADKYFIEWIESVQKTTLNAGDGLEGKSYYQELSFKPIVDYCDVSVMVTAPDQGKGTCDASFNDAELKKRGQQLTFHAGDKLELSATSSEGAYRVTGFEVSEDGGVHFNSIRDTSFFTLQPNKNYVFRPLLELNDNHVEVVFAGNAARNNLKIENLIADSALEAVGLKGKNVIDLNPDKTAAKDKMKTSVGAACTVRVLVTGKPSKPGYIYRPVFKDRMTGIKYNSQAYSFIQRSNTADNVIEVDIEEVLASDIKEYSIGGTVMSRLGSVRVDGLGLHSNPAEGYTVSMANGETEITVGGKKEKHVSFVSSSADSEGTVSLAGIKAKDGDRISLLADNGMNDAQIIELVIKGSEKNAVTGVTKVNAGLMEIHYPANAPRVTDLSYDYDKASSRQKVDLRQNQVRCFDDNLTLSASVDPKGRTVEKLVFSVRTVTGATAKYEAKPDAQNPNLFTVTINAMLENLHNGDRITVYAVDKEKRSIVAGGSTQQVEIVYPTVETGLVTFVENEVIAPKEFIIDEDMGDINIPLLGAAKGSAQSGILNFSRIDYPNKQGFSLNINLDMMLNRQSMTSEQKKDAVKNFTRSVKNAADKKKEAAAAGQQAENAGYNADQIRKIVEEGGELTPEQEQSLNDYNARKEAAEAIRDRAMTQAKNEEASLTKTKSVVDVRVIFNLAFEFLYDPVRQEYVLATAAVTVGGAVDASNTIYTMVGYVPCFLNVAGGVEADITLGGVCKEGKDAYSEGDFNGYQGNVRQMFTGSDFLTEFDAVGKLKVQVGAGMCGVLSARGYVKADVQLQFVQNNVSEYPYGIILDCGGGIGFDLVLMSFDMDIVKVSAGWGNFAGRTGVSFFNNSVNSVSAGTSGLTQANAYSESYSLQTADRMSVSEYYTGTSDLTDFGKNVPNAQPVPVSLQILLDNAAERTRPELVDLPGGGQLAVFIASSADGDRSCLYYTVRSSRTAVWSRPQPVDASSAYKDTYDSMPDLLVYGNKVLIAWMDANDQIDGKSSFKERYNAFGISGAVYDASSNTMGAPFRVTSDQDEAFYNYEPKLSAVGNNVFCTYIVRDLSNITKPEQLADLTIDYSTMGRAKIDLGTSGSTSAPSASEHEYVVIRHPTITDPLVVDYQTEGLKIGTTEYLITAYTIDEDGDLTTADRNLYLGIRDLSDIGNWWGTNAANPKPKDYYPIRIRSDESCQAVPKLTGVNDRLILSWTSDGQLLEALDVTTLLKTLFHNDSASSASVNISSVFRDDYASEEWYKKTADELRIIQSPSDPNNSTSDYVSYYEGSYYEALYNGDFRTVETAICNNEGQRSSIEDYSIVTDGKDLYIFYTDLDPDSENAAVELYGRRYSQHPESSGINEDNTGSEWGFTDAVQITDFGMVIDDFDMTMDTTGNICLLSDYYRQWIDDDGRIQYSGNALAEIDFDKTGSLDIREYSIDTDQNMIPGTTSTVEFEVVNYGLMETSGFNVSAELKGNGTSTVIMNATHYDAVLDTNEGTVIQLPWTVPQEDLNGCSIILHVAETDSNSNVIGQETMAEIMLSSRENLKISIDKVEPADGAGLIKGTVANIGNIPSEPCTVYAYAVSEHGGTDGRELNGTSVPAIAPGEERAIELEYIPVIGDWNGFGSTEIKLAAVRNGIEICSGYEDIYSSKPLMLDIDDGIEKVSMTKGTTASLSVKAAPWNALCTDIMYFSSDNSIATVSADGTVSADSKGSCTITAYSTVFGIKDTITVAVTEGGGKEEGVRKYYSDSGNDEGTVSRGTIFGGAFIPSWVETKGQWEINPDGSWRYVLNNENVSDSWLCVLNPYSDPVLAQKRYGWFRFDPSGKMLTGWFTDSDGNIYYLNPLSDNTMGMMLVGWQLINGRWYYFSEAEGSGTMGAMLRDTVTPDGYRVNRDGVWIQ